MAHRRRLAPFPALLLLLLHIAATTCLPQSSRARYLHSQSRSLHHTVHSYLRNGGQQRMQQLFNLSQNVLYNPLHTFTREHAHERQPDGSVVPRYLTAPQQPTSDLQILRAMGLHIPGIDPEHKLSTVDRQSTQQCIGSNIRYLVKGDKSDILITYSPNTPKDIEPPVEFSVRKWADQFESDVQIRICFAWSAIGDETLGATTTPFLTLGQGISRLRDDAIYNPALAASLQGVDPIDDRSKFHVHMLLNSAIPWHLDIGTRAPSRTYDLATTVLHELTHGLFFSGTLKVPEEPDPSVAEFSQKTPGRFDQFMQVEGNIGVVRSCTDGTNLFRAITSPNLRFVDRQSGSTFGLYAPFPFASGSSVYHFNNTRSLRKDCEGMGIPNDRCSDLMTHELVQRYTQRNLGETTLRVYRALRSSAAGPARGGVCQVPDYSSRLPSQTTGTRTNGVGPFHLQTWSIVTVAVIGGIGALVVLGVVISTMTRSG